MDALITRPTFPKESSRAIRAFVRWALRVHGVSLNARLHVLAHFIAPVMCVAFVQGTRLRLRFFSFQEYNGQFNHL